MESYRFGTPFLAFGVGDIRGIGNVPELRLDGQQRIAFRPGTQGSVLGEGLHAPLPPREGQWSGRIEFAFDLALLGTTSLEFVPVGRETAVQMHADWPHPSFTGNFLPVEREIDASGFRARWATTFFSTNMEELLRACVAGRECERFRSPGFGFSLIDPVDQS